MGISTHVTVPTTGPRTSAGPYVFCYWAAVKMYFKDGAVLLMDDTGPPVLGTKNDWGPLS